MRTAATQPHRPRPTGSRRLGRLLATVLAVLAVGSVIGVAPLPGPAAPAADATEAWQLEMLAQVNAYRAANGVGPLALCANLNDVARAHSQDQANRGVLSHTGWDGSQPADRIGRSSYGAWRAAGENVAVGYDSVGQVMSGWIGSGGHRANLLSTNYTHVGFGRVYGSYQGFANMPYWTQDFATGGWCAPAVNDAFGSFELATSPSAGRVRVAGWAMDRDAGTGAVEVHAYVDGVGRNLGAANRRRDDLLGLGLGAYHGFDVTFSTTPGSHQVCTYAINVGSGSNAALGCRTVWVPDPASPYTDLLSTNPFFDAIVWMRSNGYASGNADGTFGIDEPTTRQAMAAFLYRVSGSPRGADPTCSSNPFSDVSRSHPFCGEIRWMKDVGLANGYSDGTYRPGTTVSRQATVAFLHRLSSSPPPRSNAIGFVDVPSNHTFRTPILWASGAGVTTGWPDGTFRPGTEVSRQAMAAFLYRWRT